MRKNLLPILTFILFAFCQTMAVAQVNDVQVISTINVDSIFDEAATEIVAFDPVSNRLFSTNGNKGQIDIFDISNPDTILRAGAIQIDSIGAGANSLAFNNGILAAAIQANVLTDNGFVVMYDANGTFLKKIEVGANPDMVTFSNDGNYVLTANEGEVDDDDPANNFNPEGSVSIIDISGGIDAATVQTATLEGYNDKKYHLINKGVRIYDSVLVAEDPDIYVFPTVAEDLEPEYVAVSPDNTTAYVTCQENNAILVVDIANAEVIDIYSLGYKDHSKGAPELTEYFINELDNLPPLGTPVYDGGETVFLGGFSGLYYDYTQSTEDSYVFYAIPDRGPNDASVNRTNVTGVNGFDNPTQNIRPFKLPDYQARLVKLTLDVSSGTLSLDDNQLMLYAPDGITPISGKGNIPGTDEVPVTYVDDTFYPDTAYVSNDNVAFAALPYDRFGGDFEGVVRDNAGNFWMCDEYRPAIYKFGADGVLKNRFVAEGTAAFVDSMPGYYGDETLPAVYAKRRANRGFEAIAYDSTEQIIYAFIQTPLYNPDASTRNNSDVIRIIGVDTSGTAVAEYVYLLERNRDSGFSLGRVDKIGDACYIGNKKFIVLERDSSVPGQNNGKKYVYTIDLNGATNIIGTPLSEKTVSTGPDDKTLEMMTADDLFAAGVQPVFKLKTLNLPSIGYLPSDKPEGLALLPNGSFAVLNDNDFGLAGAGVSDNSVLGIIDFRNNYGLDASDRDDAINIANYPVLGMLTSDAITSYEVGGETFFVVANEGDDRGEDERIEDLELDPIAFPNKAALQTDEQFGRLNVAKTDGDIDGDGDYDYLYSFGARSFTIFDQYGNLIYDSGDDFEQITAALFPDYFNTDNDNNDFDDKSDSQGPEPEAIELGEIDGEQYAFIGMEDIGGFFAYNISNPYQPEYILYENNRDFTKNPDDSQEDYLAAGDLGIEDILFISAADSPNDENILAVANEVSGTITLFSLVDSTSQPGTARAQFIHDSPTPTVDIYVNGDLFRDNFAFRTATPFLDVPGGVQLDVAIAPANSTSAADAIANFPVTFENDNTYIVVAAGVVGGNPGFDLKIFDMGKEMADDPNNVGVLFFHGSPDAPEIDIIESGSPLFDNTAFGEFNGYVDIPAATYEVSITPFNDNTNILASYQAPFGFWKGRTAVIFATGFFGDGNAAFEPWVALSNGGTFPLKPVSLPTPKTRLQIIHNSPTPTVDVYVNDALFLDNFAYRTATPFVEVDANTTLNIGIALGNSTSSADVLVNFPVTLDPNQAYVAVANGIVGSNPAFNLELFDMAQTQADDPNNVGLLFFHGSTDAPEVDIVTGGAPLFDDVEYSEFSGYVNVPASSYTLDVTPFNDNNNVVARFLGDFNFWKGNSAVVFATGFFDGSAPPFGAWVALSNGGTYPLPELSLATSNSGEESGINTANAVADWSVNPNPIKNNAIFTTTLTAEANVSAVLYSVNGQVVRMFNFGILNEGSHQLDMNFGNIEDGIYMLQVINGEHVSSKTLIVDMQ